MSLTNAGPRPAGRVFVAVRTAGGLVVRFDRVPRPVLELFVGRAVRPEATADGRVRTAHQTRRLVVPVREVDLAPAEYPARGDADLVLGPASYPDVVALAGRADAPGRASARHVYWVPPGLADLFLDELGRAGWTGRLDDRIGPAAASAVTLFRHAPRVPDDWIARLTAGPTVRPALVLAKRKADVIRLRTRFRAAADPARNRVEVTTFRGHRHVADGRPDEFGLVVFADALDAAREVGREAVVELGARNPGARLVGFLPADRPLSPWDRDLVTSLFGTAPVDLGADGSRLPPVRVVLAAYPAGGPRNAPLGEALAAGPRTRAVADLARGIAAGNPATLGRLGLTGGAAGDAVVVLAATPGHAAALRHAIGPADRVVVLTSVELRAAALPAGLLVRADGGTGLPPGLTPRVRATCSRPELLLVDFLDRHAPALRRRLRRRLAAYAGQFWAIGRDDVHGRAAFRLTRPGKGGQCRTR